ncbi:ABC transporter ATP-binding protein [Staphylococcus sp. SQ8-PEA]|uniref:ABC transporter ATP-binding protein n=1 Tax=Staphylococcus marylandisciuri TaxID=2981529 RepID=A0ABT2QMZ1_9STAP|nr:ABC transporter ATP-binding protein [Staphylococcus marylandisciuri]MCU5745332.1 ABC transporter ATP-binding protein [Staphylococcus marylandisciuri]
MEQLLSVNELSKCYPNSEFELRDISFEVNKGEAVAFIGKNGSGKSTTINTVVGNTLKDSGVIKFFGHEILEDDFDYKNDVGVVFDTMKLPKKLHVKHIERLLQDMFRNWDSKTFWSYIEEFELPKDQKVDKFSRGMSMKLSMAIALSHHSKLLLLDEATAGIDASGREQILEILEQLKEEGIGLIISSHIVEDLEYIADRLIFMRQGEIVMSIPKETLMNQYYIIETEEDKYSSVPRELVHADRYHRDKVQALVSGKAEIEGINFEPIHTIDEVTKILMRGEIK